MSYHLCAAGVTLRNQINRKWPRRDKKSDGWIGDTRHSATKSDHNPDRKAGGVVRAIDIDADLKIKAGDHALAEELAEQLRIAAKLGEHRISYIIFQGRIASAKSDWKWRIYTGTSPHNHHIHCSFTPAGDDDGSRFRLPILKILGGTPAVKAS